MTTVSKGAHPGRLQATSVTEIAASFGSLKRSRVHCASRSTAWRRSGPFLTDANTASAYQNPSTVRARCGRRARCMRKCADGAPRSLPAGRRHGLARHALALADAARLLAQKAQPGRKLPAARDPARGTRRRLARASPLGTPGLQPDASEQET